jgi:hypothetical protein
MTMGQQKRPFTYERTDSTYHRAANLLTRPSHRRRSTRAHVQLLREPGSVAASREAVGAKPRPGSRHTGRAPPRARGGTGPSAAAWDGAAST